MPDTEISNVSTPAWVITPNPHFKIALAESNMMEYIRDSTLHYIPDAVDYCNQLVVWRDLFIPVIDFNIILGGAALDAQHIAVLCYQEYSGQLPKYVAVKLNSEVTRVTVMDDNACDWPEDYPLEIQPIVQALFMNEGELVSVINVADLCNEGFRDYLAQLAKVQVAV